MYDYYYVEVILRGFNCALAYDIKIISIPITAQIKLIEI